MEETIINNNTVVLRIPNKLVVPSPQSEKQRDGHPTHDVDGAPDCGQQPTRRRSPGGKRGRHGSVRQCAGEQPRLVVHDRRRVRRAPARSGTRRPRRPRLPGDSNAVELGLRFRAEAGGTIGGIRFYKATANTGTHTGSLWTNTGTLLATTTFINETASGWQQVNFSSPINVTANTTYVVSYHTNTGNYGVNGGYFASAGRGQRAAPRAGHRRRRRQRRISTARARFRPRPSTPPTTGWTSCTTRAHRTRRRPPC